MQQGILLLEVFDMKLVIGLVLAVAQLNAAAQTIIVDDYFCRKSDHNLEFKADPVFKQVDVRWRPVDDVGKFCKPGEIACAFVDISTRKEDAGKVTCTVITAKNLNLAILGHEMRHCFELGWHR